MALDYGRLGAALPPSLRIPHSPSHPHILLSQPRLFAGPSSSISASRCLTVRTVSSLAAAPRGSRVGPNRQTAAQPSTSGRGGDERSAPGRWQGPEGYQEAGPSASDILSGSGSKGGGAGTPPGRRRAGKKGGEPQRLAKVGALHTLHIYLWNPIDP